ncbi:MAG: hypothetical protein ACTHJQ_19080 [Rhizobiaceae bacterium]|jgi:hypothetical protein
MMKLSDLDDPIFEEPPFPIGEGEERFFPCPACGQIVDGEDLKEILWHAMPDHERLEMDA